MVCSVAPACRFLDLTDLSGSRGAGKAIPPHAALVFHVELVGLERDKHQEL